MKKIIGVGFLTAVLAACSGGSSNGGISSSTATELEGTWVSNCTDSDVIDGQVIYSIETMSFEGQGLTFVGVDYSDAQCLNATGNIDRLSGNFSIGDDLTASDGLSVKRLTLRGEGVINGEEGEFENELVYRINGAELNLGEYDEDGTVSLDSEVTYSKQPSVLATQTGVLMDSAVANVSYRTATHNGITNEYGQFQYEPGESVAFSIGGIVFPEVAAKATITPLDWAGTNNIGYPPVINMIRLLQTLDRDGNPENGIQITEQAARTNSELNFNLSSKGFSESEAVNNLIMNAGQDIATTGLIPMDTAIAHFKAALDANALVYIENYASDMDLDGVLDSEDVFPDDRSESKDTDGDGVGNNADAFPEDASEIADTDQDGVGDNSDRFPEDPAETKDTDNDGVGDNSDIFPEDSTETVDTDNDGTGDNKDAFPRNSEFQHKLVANVTGLNGSTMLKLNLERKTISEDGSYEFELKDGNSFAFAAENPSETEFCYVLPKVRVANRSFELDVQCQDRILIDDVIAAQTDSNAAKCITDAKEELVYADEISTIECISSDISSITGLSDFVYLRKLSLSGNNLTELNVSGNHNLADLSASSNDLVELDLSANKELYSLHVSFNDLASLDIPLDTRLNYIRVRENNLNSLNLSTNKYLRELDIANNAFTSLSISEQSELRLLDVSGNQLTELNVSSYSDLKILRTENNQITYLDLSNKFELTELGISGDFVSEIPESIPAQLNYLVIRDYEPASLDFSAFVNLTSLNVSENNLKSIDVSKNIKLTSLYALYNQLEELDISTNTALTRLSVIDNELTTLNLSANTKLESLFISGNMLTELDLSSNVELSGVYATRNNLTDAPFGIEQINNTQATIELGSNPFSESALLKLEELKETYSGLSW